MSPWTRYFASSRRHHRGYTKGAWRRAFSNARLLTFGAVVSLVYLFYLFVLPQILKFRLRSDLSWYDLGLYGFGPTRGYVSFEEESPVVEISQWDTGCDPRFTFIAPRGDSIGHPGPMILDAAGNLVWMKHIQDVTQDFKLQRYQEEDFLTYWEGKEVAGRGDGSWYMVRAGSFAGGAIQHR